MSTKHKKAQPKLPRLGTPERDALINAANIAAAKKKVRRVYPGDMARRIDGFASPKPNLKGMPVHDYSLTTSLNQFLLDYRSGAEFVFDLHPHLLSEVVFAQIDRCVTRRWPNLWRSDMRALMEGPLQFVKLIPLHSTARTDCMLKFMDALWTAHWSGWLDKLIPKDPNAEPTLGEQLEALIRYGDAKEYKQVRFSDGASAVATTPPLLSAPRSNRRGAVGGADDVATFDDMALDVPLDSLLDEADDVEDGESENTDD